MGKRIFRLLVGIFLIALGGLFLLDTFGFLPVEVELVFSVGLLAIGFTFILHSFKEEESWRWFIPGGIVLTLGAIGLLGYFEIMKDEFLGALVLAGFAFSFLPAFFLKERKDWAIYPSWFLLVLSGTVLTDTFFHQDGITGGVFLIGSGALFLFLLLFRKERWALYPAWFLILLGIVSFSSILRIYSAGGLAGGGFLFGIGLLFLALFKRRRSLPLYFLGFMLLVLGVVTIVATSPVPTPIAGTIFLSGLAFAFLSLYLLDRRNWWGVFLFGLFATLSLYPLDAFYSWWSSVVEAFVFFVGLSVSFFLVSLVPAERRTFRWARITGFFFLVFSFLILLAGKFPEFADFIVPIALILFGGYLVLRGIQGLRIKEEEPDS